MKAAFIERLGPPELIRYGELPLPTPGPTDVLVRVEVTAVDPVDTLVRSGRYRTLVPFPFIIGRDLVGTVADAGPGAAGFQAGERVWCNSLGHAGRQGAAAEYALVPSDRLYRLPAGVDEVAAVAVMHPAATAYLALENHGRLLPGETVYIAGGAGHVGSAAITLAAQSGAHVIVSAREEDHAYCRALGAHVTLDYRDRALPRRLREAAPAGVDVYLDTSGTNDLPTAVGVLAQRGRIVVMSGVATSAALPVGELYSKDGSVLGFAISNARVEELAAAARWLNNVLAQGALAPRAVTELPLASAAEAHARLEAGRTGGARLVLRP